MFSSKTPRDLREQRSLKGLRPANHDPLPFIYRSPDYVARYATNSPGHPYASQPEHEPRPEYDHVQHNPPNPHLTALRERLQAPDASNEVYWALRGADQWYISLTAWGREIPPALEHARKVLQRLANLAKPC